jgi:DNA-binding CsgD family transcriptional regulator
MRTDLRPAITASTFYEPTCRFQFPARGFDEPAPATAPALPSPFPPTDDSIDLRKLTLREKEIVFWILRGKPDWQIAEILAISHKTVNYHVEQFKRKLNAATRIQAIVLASRLGLLDEVDEPRPAAPSGDA